MRQDEAATHIINHKFIKWQQKLLRKAINTTSYELNTDRRMNHKDHKERINGTAGSEGRIPVSSWLQFPNNFKSSMAQV